MSFVARILSRFDEALDWPDDLFLSEVEPVEDWVPMAAPEHISARTA